MSGPGRRVGTSVVRFNSMGKTVVLDLCEECTQVVLADLDARDATAQAYLKEARGDLNRAAKRFPKHQGIQDALKQVRKVELLAGAEKPKRRACFIATAAFGSESADEVAVLRRYRDEVLERSAAGRCFTRAYYLLSPPLAALVAASPPARSAVRFLLRPVAGWCARRLERRTGRDGQSSLPTPLG